MFYCDPCGKKNGWPTGMPMSHGNCEICNNRSDCNDVPSRSLPMNTFQRTEFNRVMALPIPDKVRIEYPDTLEGNTVNDPQDLLYALRRLSAAAKLPSGGRWSGTISNQNGHYVGRDQRVWDELDAAVKHADMIIKGHNR